MKFTVERPVELDIAAVRICIPLRYDDDGGMDKNFPLRSGNQWLATVDIDTGKIREWPPEKTGLFEIHEKVVDEGIYELIDGSGVQVAILHHEYVPDVVPGEYGDYVVMTILDGVIKNWPRNPNVADFFEDE